MDHQITNFQQLIRPIKIAFGLVAVLWIIHLLRFTPLLDGPVAPFGIYPRRVFGLTGILTAPLFHSGWKHLLSNSVPLIAMFTVMWAFYRRVALQSTLLIYVLTGLAVWLLGRSVWHVGASGVVYGLVSFVFWSGVFRRSMKSVVLALIVVMIYTPMFAGILPNQEGISWESHLLGGVVGILVAWWFRKYIEAEEVPQRYEWQDEENSSHFLDRDTFTMTKEEREYWKRINSTGKEDPLP